MSYLSTVADVDPAVHSLAMREAVRQATKIRLIPSENYASDAVYEAAMSVFNNKYAEGYSGARYYEGTQIIDELEDLTKSRLCALFNMPNANVQTYSGSPANLAAYMAVLKPGDKLMGLHLPSGGHLSHGWKVTASGKIFKSSFYGYAPDLGIEGFDAETGTLDYEAILRQAKKEQPKLLIAGASSYPRTIDFSKFREIADEVGALLLADISHISGLIVGGVHPSPAGHADIITSTTHKLLRGPRGAFILSSDRMIEKNGKQVRIAKLIDQAVFPSLQGGAHYSAVAAFAVCLHEAAQPSFTDYAKQVVSNAKTLANLLVDRGFHLVTGGTDNHLLIADVHRSFSISGKEYAKALDKAGIVCNFNTVPADPRPVGDPSGVRIGTPAITSRGFKEDDMLIIADSMASVAQDSSSDNLTAVRKRVEELLSQTKFAIPGVPRSVQAQAFQTGE